jgi:hypothetical protein
VVGDAETRTARNHVPPLWHDLSHLKVGVLELRSRLPGEPVDTETLTEILITHLVTIRAFRVVEREKTRVAVMERRFLSETAGTGEVVPVPTVSGVDKLVAGSIARIGDTYVVLVRGIDARSGVIEIGDQVAARSLRELVEALGVLADRLVRKARGERLPNFGLPDERRRRERADLAGDYRLSGRNSDGSAYRGLVRIRESGGGYRVLWLVGRDLYRGTGVRIGDRFTAGWGEGRPITYHIHSNGVLEGRWDDGEATETLTPV